MYKNIINNDSWEDIRKKQSTNIQKKTNNGRILNENRTIHGFSMNSTRKWKTFVHENENIVIAYEKYKRFMKEE